jgi:uncharacterized membrane protein YhdT
VKGTTSYYEFNFNPYCICNLTFFYACIKEKFADIGCGKFTFRSFDFYSTFKPYLFIALLLVAGKFLLADLKFNINYPGIQLKKSISAFQPGLIFVVGLLLLWVNNKNKAEISLKTIFGQTAIRLPVTLVTIVCLAILAKLVSQDLDLGNVFSSANIPAPLF